MNFFFNLLVSYDVLDHKVSESNTYAEQIQTEGKSDYRGNSNNEVGEMCRIDLEAYRSLLISMGIHKLLVT